MGEARQHITIINLKTDMLFDSLVFKIRGWKYRY